MTLQMNTRVMSALCPFLVGTVLVGGLLIHPAYARVKKKAGGSSQIIQAYGAFGRLPSTGDHRSPDGKFILRATHHDDDTTNVEVIDAKSGKGLADAVDVMGFVWVPGRGHRMVVAACGIYGKAMLVMWERGKQWRSLHRVRRPTEECFALYGVTKDGRFIIYGHDPVDVDGLRRRRRLRLPPR